MFFSMLSIEGWTAFAFAAGGTVGLLLRRQVLLRYCAERDLARAALGVADDELGDALLEVENLKTEISRLQRNQNVVLRRVP